MFRSTLVLEAAPQADTWVVAKHRLVWDYFETGKIVVPVGFRTDLASIPRFLRGLPGLDVNGVSRRAAVLHDYLYAYQDRGKAFADRALRIALRADGADWWAAWAYFLAVKWFGGPAWRGHSVSRETSTLPIAMPAPPASSPDREAGHVGREL